jgi:fumarate reductase flavoprotein subunit
MTLHMSRRSFLKDAAVLGAGGAAIGMGLTGCSPSKNSKSGYTPGTYTYQATGHNAPFDLDVTFTENAITDIEADDNLESLGVGRYALSKLSKDIITTQSLNCDTVSGATLTSQAVLQGIEDCAKQAGNTKELKAAQGPADDEQTTYDGDVCVIGGGGAGLCAAITAAKAGAKVIVVEKCGMFGGSTNVSEGALNAVDPWRQNAQGITDSIETFYNSTMTGGHNQGTPELVHFLTDHALDSVHWLEGLGVHFKNEVGSATGSLGERSHYPFTPYGNTYIRSFLEYVKENPDVMTLLSETQAKELTTDTTGAVTGVKASHKGSDVTINVPSVIIATGGFGANVDYRQQVNTGVWSDVVLDQSIGCTNIKPCAQGEGLKLAENVGAKLIGLSDIQLHPCGTPGTGLMEDIRTSGRNRIFVNESGDRFVNEGAARDTLCKAIFAQPDSTYWIVVNKLRYPTPTTPDANGATVATMIARGHVTAADTLDELASSTGMDPSKLKASIDTYNAVVSGAQTDPLGFTANNTADAQMTEGPWYACKKVPTVHHTMGGLEIDVNSEVLNTNDQPIKGLYACGEVTGGIHGSNRLGGNAICDCMTFGRNAGTHAAQNAGVSVS